MARASDNPFPSVLLVEGAAPTAPAGGRHRLFVDTADNRLKRIDDAGAVASIEGGGTALLYDAKGDILAATGPDTPVRVAVGGDGTVLTADAAQANGVRWATPAQGGHVIRDEGTDLAARARVNFTGAGVTATDDAAGNQTVVTIPGATGGGGTAVTISDVRRNAALTAAPINGTWTDLPFDAEQEDGLNVFAVPQTSFTLAAGLYRLEAEVAWAVSATGARGIRLQTAADVLAADLRAAVGGENPGNQLVTTQRFAVATTMRFTVYQTSGGALALAAGQGRPWLARAVITKLA